MNKDVLKDFLNWLEKEGIARWYFIDESCGAEGIDSIVERYMNNESTDRGEE
jgi:hypothetical protein